MRRSVLIGLGLAAIAGLIIISSRSGPGTDPAPPSTETPPQTNGAPVSEFDRTPSPTPPETGDPVKPPAGATQQELAPPDSRVTRVDDKIYLNDPVRLARKMHSEGSTPTDDISAIGIALSYYVKIYKANPVGSLNEEIIAQLTGDNPKGIIVIPPDHPDINENGELLDRWGTPYFFHGLTRTAMDVWSAGPDTKFGSRDDVKLGIDEEFGEQLGLQIEE